MLIFNDLSSKQEDEINCMSYTQHKISPKIEFQNPPYMNAHQQLSMKNLLKNSNQRSMSSLIKSKQITSLFNQIPVLVRSTLMFLLFIGMTNTVEAQSCGKIVRWDINSCSADNNYSEFTASFPGTACVSVAASNVSTIGSTSHSCNPGRPSGDGVGVCKSGFTSSTYVAGSSEAFVFNMTIPANKNGSITKLNFWQFAGNPIQFLNNNNSYSNNYPTKFGVRVLKNNVEIYRQTNISTTTSWNLQELNFTGISFAYTGGENFKFELYAYSPAGLTGTTYNGIWDIDEISIEACCGNPGDVCKVNSADVFSITPVAGATSYNWTLSGPAGGSIVSGQGTNSITINWTGGTTGQQAQLCVTSVKDGCESSPICQTLNLVNCSTPVGNGWAFQCGQNVEVEVVGTGTNGNANTTLNFTNLSTIDSIVVEAVYKGGATAPSAMTFSSSSQTISALRKAVNNGGNTMGVYRTKMNPTTAISLATSLPANTYSFTAYVFRSNVAGGGTPSVGKYAETYLYYGSTPETETFTLTLPISTGPKNLTIKVPISELNVDTRIARITATAGSVTQTIEVSQPNLGTSLNITPFTLANVPGNVTSLTVTLKSPNPSTDPAGKTGDSFVFGGAVFVGVQCSNNFQAVATGSNLNCYGDVNGSVNLTVTGGISPFTYNWSNGATTQNLSGVGAGTYSVTVTDNNSNSVITSATVTQPNSLLPNAVAIGVSAANANNGSATANPTGGTPGYTYAWNTGAVTKTISNLAPGTYTVTVTDTKGCTGIQSVVVEPFICDLATSTTTLQNVSCNAGNNGSIKALPTAGTAPYSYLWNTGATTQTLSGRPAGTYTVTVTDSKGCTAGASGVVTEPTAIVVNASSTNETTLNANNGTATANPFNGTAPYTYSWSNGATTKSITNLAPGSYTITVTDANGCPATATVNVAAVTCGAITVGVSTTNPACNGQTTGTATANPSGGTAPYTYLWSTGSTAQTITGLGAGPVSVTVTDSKGCTATGSATIIQPSVLSSGAVATNVTCHGASNGTVELTVSGGTTPYSFSWSNGATTEDLSGLPPGNYTVVVTDAKGCQSFVGVTVTEPAVLVANAVGGPETALNANNGTATASPTGGTTPYTYSWNTGATTPSISSLSPGTYTVTVTDANSCTSIQSVVVEPFICNLAAVASATNASCNGGSNGTATATAFSGTAPYTYAWSTSPVKTTQVATNLIAGTYTVTITDSKGCTAGASTIVSEPNAITVNASATGETSFGASDGTATANPSGGTSPYTYSWSSGAGTKTITGLASGTYCVTITDAKGCTQSACVTVSGISCASFNVGATQTNINCNGQSTGTATANPTGGQAPYTYIWSANTGSQTAQTATGLIAGTYSVTVTDNVGCSKTKSVTITQPSVLSAGTVATNVTCFGAANGTIELTMSGGTQPYVYSWSNGATTEDLASLTPGNYTVVVTDAKGCTTFAGALITQPNVLVANIAGTNETALNANNGTVTANPTGGTPAYTYAWSSGATTKTVSNLAPGTYTVTVTDANGCTSIESIVVEPFICDLEALANSNDADCNGGNDGTATATPLDGTGPYTYSWSNGQTAQTAINLVAGTYTVTITDSKGCTAGASTIVKEPTAIIPNASATSQTTFGVNNGTATVTPTGGTNPYIYSWSNAATTKTITGLAPGNYTITITDAKGCTATETVTVSAISCGSFTAGVTKTNPSCFGTATGSATANAQSGTAPYTYLWSTGSTAQTISNLIAGTYTVTITGNAGCTITASTTLGQPSPLSAGVVTTNISCFGAANGTMDLTVSGGTSPYTYAWNNGATTQDLSNLAPGTYSVVITDANGCIANAGGTVTTPNELFANATSTGETAVNADNGTATVAPTGGTSPYTYAWTTGATTQSVSSLAPGTYTVTVTDANGCKDIESVVIEEFGCGLTATIGVNNNVTCNGGADGSATVTPSAGNTPYTYLWNTSPAQTTATASGLTAGTYTVTVTDATNCTITQTITITQPTVITITNVVATPVSNCNLTDGKISITASGPGALNYSIDNGTTWQASDLFIGLAAGTYNILVRNTNGTCVKTYGSNPVTITAPSAPVISGVSSTDPSNCGVNDGTITIAATGASGTLRYSINGGFSFQVSNVFNSLAAGTYNIVVKYSNNTCSVNGATQILTAPSSPSISNIVSTNPTNCGLNNGTITVTASGASGTLQYSNDGGLTWQASNVFNSLAAGTYAIRVRYTGGTCTVSGATQTLTAPVAPTITNIAAANPTNCGVNDGTIQITATGNGALQYSINNGTTWQSSDLFVGLAAGTYQIKIRNVDGSCVVTGTPQTLTAPQLPVITNVVSNDPSNCGVNDGTITVTATGTNIQYSIDGGTNWQSSGSFTALAAGTYNVAVRNNNGTCLVYDTGNPVVLEAPNAPSITNIASTNPSNCGLTDGTITVSATGGSGSYEYSKDGGLTWGNTTGLFTGLAGGSYPIKVRNAGGTCTVTGATIVLTDKVAPTIATVTPTNPTNCGINDGTITINASGSGALQYSINGGSTWQASDVGCTKDKKNSSYF
jgi:hypothetical protein